MKQKRIKTFVPARLHCVIVHSLLFIGLFCHEYTNCLLLVAQFLVFFANSLRSEQVVGNKKPITCGTYDAILRQSGNTTFFQKKHSQID